MEKHTWIERILENRPLAHLLWWLGMLFFYPFYAGIFGAPFLPSLVIKLAYLPVQIAAAYLLLYVQIPQLIFTRRYGWFLLSLAFTLPFFAVLAHFTDDYVLARMYAAHAPHPPAAILREAFSPYYLFAAYLIPLIMTGGKLAKQRLKDQQTLERLEKEKARAELQWLKAQIHPRFLFNTLDYLYELTLRESDAAPEVVIKLSDMLDYMLYDGNAPTVELAGEAAGIRRYIELEAGRYGGRLVWTYDVEIADPAARITPLVLLSAVEEAFRHGVSELMEAPVMHVSLRADPKRLDLEVRTNRSWLTDRTKQSKELIDMPVNLQRQLALAYPDRHSFHERKEGERYHTLLTLEMA